MHLCGIIFTTTKEEVDSSLEKFDANLEVEPYTDRSPTELLEWARQEIDDVVNTYEASLKKNSSSAEFYQTRFENLLVKYNLGKTDSDLWAFIKDNVDVDEYGYEISSINPDALYDWYTIGGRWSGEILHAGEYDTDQAAKEYLTKIDTPFMYIDLDGDLHDDHADPNFEKEFRKYLDSVPSDTILTVIDFHV